MGRVEYLYYDLDLLSPDAISWHLPPFPFTLQKEDKGALSDITNVSMRVMHYIDSLIDRNGIPIEKHGCFEPNRLYAGTLLRHCKQWLPRVHLSTNASSFLPLITLV
jgi:hypothetical protein